MADLVETGPKPTAANTKKKARKVTPKLKCMVTGQERFTNADYLEGKAKAAGSVNRFVQHYICSDAMKRLRAMPEITDKTLGELRTALKVKAEDIKDMKVPTMSDLKIALETNGKRKAKKVAAKAKPAAAVKPAAAKKAATPAAAKAPTPAPATAPTAAKTEKTEAPATANS